MEATIENKIEPEVTSELTTKMVEDGIKDVLSVAKIHKDSLGVSEIIAIALEVLQYIKEHGDIGKMGQFRTKDANGDWEKGNHFADKDLVVAWKFDADIFGFVKDLIPKKAKRPNA